VSKLYRLSCCCCCGSLSGSESEYGTLSVEDDVVDTSNDDVKKNSIMRTNCKTTKRRGVVPAVNSDCAGDGTGDDDGLSFLISDPFVLFLSLSPRIPNR
jgi:hypothetical protein